MLENVGHKIDFVVEMSVKQDRRGFVHPLNFPRQDKGQSPNDKSHALRARFFSRKRTEFTPDLKMLRKLVGKKKPLPSPDPRGACLDWYDGSSIRGASITKEARAALARGIGEFGISGQVRPGGVKR
jgi:hypothetical protein